MTTIANLVVAAAVDPSGIRTGLNEAVGYLRQFGRSAQQELRETFDYFGDTGERAGEEAGRALLGGLNRQFATIQARLREQFARGMIDRAQFEREGSQAAQAFNQALLAGIAELRSKGIMSDEMEVALVGQLRESGIRAGEEFAANLAATTRARSAEATAGVAVVARRISQNLGIVQRDMVATGHSTGLMSHSVMIGLGELSRGVARVAQTGTVGAFAIREFTGAAFRLGTILGAAGGLIGVVFTLGYALHEVLFGARKEMEETRKKFEEEVGKMANAGQSVQLQQKLRDLDFGQPYMEKDGKTTLRRASQFISGAFEGSLKDLEGQRAHVANELWTALNAGNQTAARLFRKQLTELDQMIAPMIEDRKKLTAAILNVADQPASMTGVLPWKVNEKAPGKADEPFRDLTKHVQELITAYKQLDSAGQPVGAAYRQLNALWDQAGDLLAAQPDKLGSAAVALRKIREEIQGTITPLARMNAGALDLAITPGGTNPAEGDEQRATQALVQRLDTVRALYGEYSREAQSVYRQLADLQRNLTDRVSAQGGPLMANTELLRAQLDITKALHAAPATAASLKDDPFSLANIAARAKAMQELAAAAKQTGASNAPALESAANAQRERAVTLVRSMVEQSDAFDLSTSEGLEVLNGILAALGLIDDTTKQTTSAFESMKTAIHGAVDAAGAFGRIGRDVQQTVNGVLHAIDAVKELNKARSAANASTALGMLTTIGAATGVVGGVIGAVSGIAGLFGGSDAARQEQMRLIEQQNQLIAQNNKRLEDMSTALSGGTGGASGIAGAAALIPDLSGIFARYLNQGKNLSIDEQRAHGLFDTYGLGEQFGVSWQQFLALVKESGIQLFDESGHILMPALGQLQSYFKMAAEAALKFSNSFDDQKTLAELHDKVFGKSSPADAFNRELALLTKFAPALAAGLDGIDVTTQEGRAKIQTALQLLVTQLEEGALTLEQMGNLTGAKQLADIISTLQDSLNSLANASDKVTGALLNVPAGYRVAAAAFAAQDPIAAGGGAGAGAGVGAGAGASVAPRLPKPSDFDGGIGRLPASPAPTFTLTGDVYVDARQEPADKLADAILKEFQRRAQNRFGTSARWPEIM